MLRRLIALFVLTSLLLPAPLLASRVNGPQNASNYLLGSSSSGGLASATDFTIAGWIKCNPLGQYHYFAYWSVGNSSFTWQVVISPTNHIQFVTVAGTNISSTATIPDTGWHHIGLTFTSTGGNAGNVVFYLDGVPEASQAALYAPQSGEDTFVVGSDKATPRPGDSNIALVMINQTVALTAGNFVTLQTSLTPESVGGTAQGSWHMLADDGASVLDSGSGNNPLAVNGTVAFSSDNPLGGGGGGSTIKHRRIQ